MSGASTFPPAHGTALRPLKLCRSEYQTPYAFGRPARNATQRFFESALLSDVPDCILWPFSTDKDGYAKMRYDGRSSIVSRVVCRLVHGASSFPRIQAGHSCHTPGCINHKHLSWKTPRENCADKAENGTLVVASQIGELNHSAKLTEHEVREIRRLSKTTSNVKLAAMFGISKSTAHSIIVRKKWRHVS